MKESVIALIDCNNFFVSCERLFDPSLLNRPVGVLSNNDGCLIARSEEIKALGIPMAAPEFKYRDILKENNAKLLSANFELYGNISKRITDVLLSYSPTIELYSIDEAFLDIADLPIKDRQLWGEELYRRILKEVGVPVCVGIGATKTQAKLATDYAKRTPEFRARGAFSLAQKYGQASLVQVLEGTPVADIWGVGRRYAKKLNSHGIVDAHQFTQLPDNWVRKEMSINGLRTKKELEGLRCIKFAQDDFDSDQKIVSTGRTFGERLYCQSDLEKTVSVLVSRAAEKLRRKKQVAGLIQIYANSGYNTEPRISIYGSLTFEQPTNLTDDVIHAALKIIEQIYRDSPKGFKKAGIVFSNLAPQDKQQLSLYRQHENTDKKQQLYDTVDIINQRYGKRTVLHASDDWTSNKWHSKSNHRSPSYTTDWTDLPHAKPLFKTN